MCDLRFHKVRGVFLVADRKHHYKQEVKTVKNRLLFEPQLILSLAPPTYCPEDDCVDDSEDDHVSHSLEPRPPLHV